MAESSNLWRRSFANADANKTVSRLLTSLRGTRENVKQLTSRIAGSLPDLTIHDITHLDALWHVAGTVAGPDFRLNPLEGYVFGTAVLLHDAGLCFEAYSGGRDAVRETLQWRDAHGRLTRAIAAGRDVHLDADFEALRMLHASQAVRLATDPWDDEQGGELHLVGDKDLRENYGRLIGELASSHHWDLEKVVRQFSTARPSAAFLNEDWMVDSLKVACLLRVADAGHVDGARAPSFLLKILQMNWVRLFFVGGPRGFLRAARQELLDASKAWWGGWRVRLADRRCCPISVSLGVVALVLARFVEVPVRIEVAAGS